MYAGDRPREALRSGTRRRRRVLEVARRELAALVVGVVGGVAAWAALSASC